MKLIAVQKQHFSDEELRAWHRYAPVFNLFYTRRPQTLPEVQKRLDDAMPGIFPQGWLEEGVASLIGVDLLIPVN